MYAVVMILDSARQRAHVHSVHDALSEAQVACGELAERHPNRELTLVLLHRAMAVGAVISREHMALGLGSLAMGAHPDGLGATLPSTAAIPS